MKDMTRPEDSCLKNEKWKEIAATRPSCCKIMFTSLQMKTLRLPEGMKFLQTAQIATILPRRQNMNLSILCTVTF